MLQACFPLRSKAERSATRIFFHLHWKNTATSFRQFKEMLWLVLVLVLCETHDMHNGVYSVGCDHISQTRRPGINSILFMLHACNRDACSTGNEADYSKIPL